MNKYILTALLALTGCATTQGTIVDNAAPQFITVDAKEVKVSGNLITPYVDDNFNGTRTWKRKIEIYFNDNLTASGYLEPRSAQGEVSGKYEGHDISSVCSSLKTSQTNLQVDCMVLIDNKRTVTLRF